MADAIVSAVAELLISTVTKQIQLEVKLVRGVEKELRDLADKLKNVRNVLDDADMKQFKDKTVKAWLRKLEQTSYEMEDVLEEWNYALIQHDKMKSGAESAAAPPKHKVCSFILSSCFSFKKLVVRHDIANKVQDLKSRLEEILEQKDAFRFVISQPTNDPSPASWRVQSTSLIDIAEIKGRNNDMDFLVKKVTAHEGLSYQVISIVGAGGLGKTALAKLVYNDSRVKQCFDFKIWICVSEPFDEAGIAREIIKAIKGSSRDTTQLEALVQDLEGCISGKRFLLVLDDLWNEQRDKWEPLENALKRGGVGSKILVTTRKEQVAITMRSVGENIYCPDLLSIDDCWLLLKDTALSGRSHNEFDCFQKIGMKIAEKCKGLPLAAKTLGSALRFKRTAREWDNILRSEMWELEKAELELFPHLLLSYHELSPSLKRCFSFCAFFPKDERIRVKELIRIWMALGYLDSNNSSDGEDMELRGQRFFDNLAMGSLFQDFEIDDYTEQIKSCKMHDIVHDFALYLRKSSREDALGMTNKTCQVCKSSLDSQAQEYRILFCNEKSHANLCGCLTSLRVLRLKYPHNLQGMDKLIHLKWLNIFKIALSMRDLKIICKLYFLQTLLLEDCSIKEIPGEIGKLVPLRLLDLSFNQKLKELPESMCNLVALRTLLLASCSLEEIPEEIGKLEQLRHLDLSLNEELKELQKSMYSMKELQTLAIKGCKNLRIPERFGELSSIISSLDWFCGGGYKKFELLKNFNSLDGCLKLRILTSSSDLKELAEEFKKQS